MNFEAPKEPVDLAALMYGGGSAGGGAGGLFGAGDLNEDPTASQQIGGNGLFDDEDESAAAPARKPMPGMTSQTKPKKQGAGVFGDMSSDDSEDGYNKNAKKPSVLDKKKNAFESSEEDDEFVPQIKTKANPKPDAKKPAANKKPALLDDSEEEDET